MDPARPQGLAAEHPLNVGLILLLQNPPNFLRASALSEHISPVVVIPAEVSSPDSEPVLEKDDLMDMDASQQVETPARGTWPFQNRQKDWGGS